MIHTESIVYVERGGRLCPATDKIFVSAPDADAVRGLFQDEFARVETPLLIITRQTQVLPAAAPANNFKP